jgi:hypothetical protein
MKKFVMILLGIIDTLSCITLLITLFLVFGVSVTYYKQLLVSIMIWCIVTTIFTILEEKGWLK